MVAKVEITDDQAISIADFIAEARQANLHCENELLDLAPAMRRLSNNKEFLEDFITRGLEDIANFQRDNLYSSQSYILENVTERSFLRFAIWAPLSFGEAIDEQNFFSYERAHNHDFSLLTVGYLGPGYRTTVHELEEQPQGYIGETVRFSAPKVIDLTPGQVLLYEAGKDVHVQHPPTSLSVSLNLIVDQADVHKRQLYFDVPSSTVAGYVGNTKLKRSVFMRYAAALNSERGKELIQKIAQSHSCDVTRIYGYRALALAEGREKVRELMCQDRSDIVRKSLHLLEDDFADNRIWG